MKYNVLRILQQVFSLLYITFSEDFEGLLRKDRQFNLKVPVS